MCLKKYLLVSIGLVFLLSGLIHESEAAGSKKSYKKGEILVKYKKAVRERNPRMIYSRTNRTSQIKSYKKTKIEHLKLPKDMTVEDAVKQFNDNPNVEFAEPNYMYSVSATPNDPYFNRLWGLHNIGQTIDGNVGAVDADVDAPEAWDIITNASDVIVAVIDSGVDYNHPDLSANIWMNTDEIPDNGIDDDGNGKVDDIQGWDFVANDNDPMDPYGHGTHVSGTIGAVGNNSIGVAGVAWQVKLMSLRALGVDGYGYTSDLIEAIEYADANGADIVNLSWGGGDYSAALKETIENSSALFVCAAGNDSKDTDYTSHYPASYDSLNIISVAAVDKDDQLADFSNYGKTSVDVAAPGVDIYSTMPPRKTLFEDNFDDGDLNGWTTGGTHNTWGVEDYYTSEPYSLSDSPNADTQSGTNSWIKSPSIDLSGETYVGLEFEFYGDIASSDYLAVEASTNGSNWVEIDQFSGYTDGWISSGFDFSQFKGTSQVSFRLRMVTSTANTEGCNIDDVAVTSMASDYTNSGYGYKSGTSMAAPYVAGIAVLIKSLRPDFTYREIKNAIENNVDTLNQLSKKVGASGRVNLYRSMINVWNKYIETSQVHQIDISADRSTDDLSSIRFENGNTIVIWSQSGERYRKIIFGQLFNANGEKIGNEFRVNSVTNAAFSEFQLIKLSSGDFLVAWNTGDYMDNPDYYAQCFSSNGSKKGTEFLIKKGIGLNQLAIGTLSNDRFIAVWGGYGSLSSIRTLNCQVFDKMGNKIGNEYVVGDLTRFGFYEYKPKVTSLANDRILITWQQTDRLNDTFVETVTGQFLDSNGVKVGTNFRINNNTDFYHNAPKIAALSNGNFVVISKNVDYVMQVFDGSGIPITEEMQIFTNIEKLSSTRPYLISDSNGRFMIVAVEYQDIWAELNDQNGNKLGNEFIINGSYYESYSTSDILLVDMYDNSFYVVWKSFDRGNNKNILYLYKKTKWLDTDSDYIIDIVEDLYCTNSLDSDTDDDNIPDGVEDANQNGMVDSGETDPCNIDTDTDRMPDGWEIQNGFNPLLNDAAGDADGDGVSNLNEFNAGTNPGNTDTDTDGMPDGWEIQNSLNPLLNDAAGDADGDGVSNLDEFNTGTNPGNTDTDNDGMPDGWELQNSLNPLLDDAEGDMDGDGVSNLDEFNEGTNASNMGPEKPVLNLPENFLTDVSLMPDLMTNGYADNENDAHTRSQWQISLEQTFSIPESVMFDLETYDHLTALKVSEFILEPNQTYYWRVRFYDGMGGRSQWSEPFSFTTLASDPQDSDGNGVPDIQQITDGTIDLDSDGVPDIGSGIYKMVNHASVSYGLKASDNVVSVDCLKSIDPDDITDSHGKPDNLDFGLIQFKLKVSNPGNTAKIRVYFSKPVGTSWYKYDLINGWEEYSQNYPNNVLFSADKKSVLLSLVDGGPGDSDGVANGIIIDPSGPGIGASNPPGASGGGGGCFIATAAYGTPMAENIIILCEFRDRFLLTNGPGRSFVKFYYKHSPGVAKYIEANKNLRTIVRALLLPVVGFSWIVLMFGIPFMLLFIFLFALGGIYLIVSTKKGQKLNNTCEIKY